MKSSYARRAGGVALLALCGAALLSSGLAAADSAQATVEMRRAEFKKMGTAMKTLIDQSKTDSPDIAKMQAAALAIDAYTGKISGWFPAGSGPESGVDTDALPYIWQARAKFDGIADELGPEAKNLAAALQTGELAGVRAQVKKLGGVCASCHRSFRAD